MQSTDLDWDTEVRKVTKDPSLLPPVNVKSTDPLYVLYTSGTTGTPKGVVRDTGGCATALRWSMANVMQMRENDVYWAASDLGWVVGHSFIVYAPLLRGCTTVLYEGKPIGTPDPGAFWRVLEEYKVKSMFTAPTALRAIRKFDPQGEFVDKYPGAKLDALFLAGERGDPKTIEFYSKVLDCPVVDNWWSTESTCGSSS